MENKKRVLIVVSSLNTGGAQRVAANLSVGLPPSCEVDFLLNESSPVTYHYRGNIIDLGFEAGMDRSSLSYQARAFFRRYGLLKRMKREKRYDATFSFLDSANIVNILTGRKYCRTIVSVHSMLSHRTDWKYRSIVVPLVRWLYKKADKVVAVSSAVKEDLTDNIGLAPDNIVMINNGFDIDEIDREGNEPLTLEDGEFFKDRTVITAMGRLHPLKGFAHLIMAMKLVSESVPNCRLVILGEGSERGALQKLIGSLGLEDHVVLAGHRDNPFAVIKRSKVFVLSSIDEAFPSVVIEALSLGIPCVSTAVAGIREIIAPDMKDLGDIGKDYFKAKYGIITPGFKNTAVEQTDGPSKEEKVLADAIIAMLTDDGLRNGYIAGSDDIRARFRVEKMAEDWMKLI